MTRDEIHKLRPGDAVLGAFGQESEHVVHRTELMHKRCRAVWLTDGNGSAAQPTLLWVGGAEVLGRMAPRPYAKEKPRF